MEEFGNLLLESNKTIQSNINDIHNRLTVIETNKTIKSLNDITNVNVTSPNTGEILSYNGTKWVRDGTIKSLTGTLDGTSYDYINVTAPQHVKASWNYSTSLNITAPHASMRLDGGLFISSKAPVTDSSGNKQVLGAIEGTPTDLEVDFMVEGTSMLIGDTFIGPNGNLVLFGDILSNSGQTILGSGGIVFDSHLSVWNEDTPKTYSSGLDGEVLVSQGHNKPPKWEPLTGPEGLLDSLESTLATKQNTLTGISDVPGLDAALATKQRNLTFATAAFPLASGGLSINNVNETNATVTYTPPDLSGFITASSVEYTAGKLNSNFPVSHGSNTPLPLVRHIGNLNWDSDVYTIQNTGDYNVSVAIGFGSGGTDAIFQAYVGLKKGNSTIFSTSFNPATVANEDDFQNGSLCFSTMESLSENDTIGIEVYQKSSGNNAVIVLASQTRLTIQRIIG